MTGRFRRFASPGLVVAALLIVSACGGDAIPEPTPDGIAGSPNDPCRLLSQSDAARILKRADLPPGVAASPDECSFTTADGSATLVYDVEDKRLFDLAMGQAKSARALVEPVTGLGDEAFFYTPRSATNDRGSVPITYLKARRRDRYFTALVGTQRGYDRDMEKQVAQRLLSGG